MLLFSSLTNEQCMLDARAAEVKGIKDDIVFVDYQSIGRA